MSIFDHSVVIVVVVDIGICPRMACRSGAGDKVGWSMVTDARGMDEACTI
jgi:hypothetical protein